MENKELQKKREDEKFCPEKIGSYFRVEWKVLLTITISGLIGRCFILDRIRISYISIPISRRIFYPHDTTIIYGNIISIRYCIADISSVCMDLIFRIHIRRDRDHPIIAA